MGRICKKFIILLGVIIIYTIFIPTLFIHHAKIIQIENSYAMPVRPIGQWDFEYVLNGTAFRELENVFDEQLNNKEKFIRFYTYVQRLLNKKVQNYRELNNNEYATGVYNPVLIKKYIDGIDTLTRELKDDSRELSCNLVPSNSWTNDDRIQDQYLKRNHQINTDGTYIAYKVILNKMNNKLSS